MICSQPTGSPVRLASSKHDNTHLIVEDVDLNILIHLVAALMVIVVVFALSLPLPSRYEATPVLLDRGNIIQVERKLTDVF